MDLFSLFIGIALGCVFSCSLQLLGMYADEREAKHRRNLGDWH